MKTFEDLICWQACRELRLFVYNTIVPALPAEEKHRMRNQLLKSARSTTANGRGRIRPLSHTILPLDTRDANLTENLM